MTRLLTLALLAALTVAEVAAVLALVDWLGPVWALVVLALDVLLGLYLMGRALVGPQPNRGFRFTAGAIIALPGLVLDLVGFALLIPVVREWVRRSLLRNTEAALERSGISVVRLTTQDVVAGTVIVEDVVDTPQGAGWPSSQPGQADSRPAQQAPGFGPGTPKDRAGGSPGPGPRVIRGEIVAGESPAEPGAAEPRTAEPAPAERADESDSDGS